MFNYKFQTEDKIKDHFHNILFGIYINSYAIFVLHNVIMKNKLNGTSSKYRTLSICSKLHFY